MSCPAVRCEGLGRRFGERWALREVSFDVPAASRVALLGPNGGGKSTLFRILSTLLTPSEGTAQVFGDDVVRDAAAARRHLGVVFQTPSLDAKLSVRENLEYQGVLYGITGAELATRIAASLDLTQLADRAADRVETLSGGMRRRVELAKVYLHQPRLVLLDEPTTGLDPAARREFWRWVDELRDRTETTVLFTTHLLDEAERTDQVILLDEGRRIAAGTPEALRGELGGDILTIDDDEPEALLEELRAKFSLPGRVVANQLRLELDDPAQAAEIFSAFKARVGSVTLGKPSLEDVFIRKTGRGLAGEARPS